MKAAKKLTEDERVAWALLELASTREANALRQIEMDKQRGVQYDTNDLSIAMEVAIATRIKLRDEFGINLDTMYDKACALYSEIRAAVSKKGPGPG